MIDLSLAVAVIAAFSVLFFVIGMEVHRHTSETSDLQKLVARFESLLDDEALKLPDKVQQQMALMHGDLVGAVTETLRAQLPTEERFRETVEAMVSIIRASEKPKPIMKRVKRSRARAA